LATPAPNALTLGSQIAGVGRRLDAWDLEVIDGTGCPMNIAFHTDGETVPMANHNEGSPAVCNLARGALLRAVQAGVGVEALSFLLGGWT
jgi:hypothetical protein